MKRQFKEWEKIFANDANRYGLNLQNIQTVHTTQQQQNKQTLHYICKDYPQ